MLQTEKQTPENAAIAATLPKWPHARLEVAATEQHLSPYHVKEDRDGRDKTGLLREAHAHICADSYCYMQLLVRVRTHAHAHCEISCALCRGHRDLALRGKDLRQFRRGHNETSIAATSPNSLEGGDQ